MKKMKRPINKIILVAMVLSLTGIASAQDALKFVGTWVNYGKPFLIVNREGDFLTLSAPENPDVWSQFQNVRLEDGKLKFEQIYFLRKAPDHPFNGVVNYSEMWEDAEGNMLFRTWIDEKQMLLPPGRVTRYIPMSEIPKENLNDVVK